MKEQSSVTDKLKSIWGSNQSRGFKAGAWAVAIIFAGGISYYQNNRINDYDAYNKSIIEKSKKK